MCVFFCIPNTVLHTYSYCIFWCVWSKTFAGLSIACCCWPAWAQAHTHTYTRTYNTSGELRFEEACIVSVCVCVCVRLLSHCFSVVLVLWVLLPEWAQHTLHTHTQPEKAYNTSGERSVTIHSNSVWGGLYWKSFSYVCVYVCALLLTPVFSCP